MFRSATTRIAHKSATFASLGGNKDLQVLQSLIDLEKNIAQSLQRLASDYDRAAEVMRTWGAGEGEDLSDILNGAQILISHYSGGLNSLAVHEENIRAHMKAIRSREESLDEMRRRRRNLGSQADTADKKLSKMGSEHKNLVAQTDQLNRLREDIRALDSEIMTEEAQISDFKRQATREWMSLKFGGLSELSGKGLISGDFGKAIAQEIPQSTTQPGLPRAVYSGGPQVQKLLMDAHEHVLQVKFDPNPPMTLGGDATPMPPGRTSGPFSAPAPDRPPILAPFEQASSLDLSHIISPPDTTPLAAVSTSTLTSGAPSSQPPSAVENYFGYDSRSSVTDEFGSMPPSGPPSHIRAAASYGESAPTAPAPSTAAATVGGRGGAPALSGPRQGAGRFATFPVKGGRPRTDSADPAEEPLITDTSSLTSQPSTLTTDGHMQPSTVSSYGSTAAAASPRSSRPLSSGSFAGIPPPPPLSPSSMGNNSRISFTGSGTTEHPPSLFIPRTASADTDFSSAVAAALSGGYSSPVGPPQHSPAVYGQPQMPIPAAHGPVSNGVTTPLSATFHSTGQPSPAHSSFDRPTSLPPGAAPPLSPPNKNYEVSPPVSVNPPSALPMIHEQSRSRSPSNSPVSSNRRSWDTAQPGGPATSIPMPHTMPTLVERPTAESFMTIETLRSESPTQPKTRFSDDEEEESQLSYMSPTRSSRFSSEAPPAASSKGERDDRRVRFGEVTVSGDEDEEEEDEDWMREADEDDETGPLKNTKQRPNSAFVRGPASMNDEEEDESEPPTPRAPQGFEAAAPPSSSPPPPAVESMPAAPMDEESLNAAAAREIALELGDIKLFRPGSDGAPLSSSSPPPPPPATDKPMPPSVRTDTLPSTRSGASPISPRASFATSPQARGRSPLPPPPSISLPRPSFSTNSSMASFSTPPEYPAPSPLSFNKPGLKSNASSLNAPAVAPATPSSPTYPTGGAKISAAAFRRAQGSRNPSASNLTGADISPLNVAKRSLPSSPYPARAQTQSPAVSPAPLDVPGRSSNAERPTSAYSTASSEFDYISSYMSSSPTTEAPPDVQGRTASGYGAGRFATNLEDENDFR